MNYITWQRTYSLLNDAVLELAKGSGSLSHRLHNAYWDSLFHIQRHESPTDEFWHDFEQIKAKLSKQDRFAYDEASEIVSKIVNLQSEAAEAFISAKTIAGLAEKAKRRKRS